MRHSGDGLIFCVYVCVCVNALIAISCAAQCQLYWHLCLVWPHPCWHHMYSLSGHSTGGHSQRIWWGFSSHPSVSVSLSLPVSLTFVVPEWEKFEIMVPFRESRQTDRRGRSIERVKVEACSTHCALGAGLMTELTSGIMTGGMMFTFAISIFFFLCIKVWFSHFLLSHTHFFSLWVWSLCFTHYCSPFSKHPELHHLTASYSKWILVNQISSSM